MPPVTSGCRDPHREHSTDRGATRSSGIASLCGVICTRSTTTLHSAGLAPGWFGDLRGERSRRGTKATPAQVGMLDPAAISRPSAGRLWVNDVVFAGLEEMVRDEVHRCGGLTEAARRSLPPGGLPAVPAWEGIG